MAKESIYFGIRLFIAGLATALAVVGFVYAWPLWLPVVLCLLASVLLLLVFRRYLQRKKSLAELDKGIQRMMDGDFSGRFYTDSRQIPWVNQLATSLNKLSDDLDIVIEDALEQNLLNEAILTGLNEGIISTDSEGLIKLETPLASKLLAADRSFNSQTYLPLRGVNHRYVWDLLAKAIANGKTEVEEIHISIGQEQRILEVYATPLHMGEIDGALAVVRNVTHIKQLERMREDFVANVSHELKTPLTSIRGYIDLLRSSRRTPEEAEQFYEILEIEADRLLFLINDLLELSEIQGGDLQRSRQESVYLYQVADEVIAELAPIAGEKSVELSISIDPDLKFRANYLRMKQLLTNLVSNAIKYNREGGSVVVSGEHVRDRLHILVEDNGIGIAEEHLPRIFERFYRVSKSRSQDVGGTGLGLAIVKHIAGLYGGSVEVDSELGVGTRFTVILPV